MPIVNFNQKSEPSNYPTEDTLRIYFREIKKIPLLTPEQEVSLGRQVRAMTILLKRKQDREKNLQRELNISEWAGLVDKSESELNRVIKIGQQAKQKTIKANLRLVITVAQKYQKRGLDFADLIQEGNLGLERGIENFDPTKGCRFSTYIYWWIRQAITRAIAKQARTIRLPNHIIKKITKIKKTQRKLAKSLGRDANITEIATALGWKTEQIQELLSLARRPISLNLLVGENPSVDLSDFLEDNRISPENYITRQFLRRDLYELMSDLKPQQKEILLLRFGLLNGGVELSLSQIAQKMKLSHEKVSQIERRALLELRRKRAGIREYILK